MLLPLSQGDRALLTRSLKVYYGLYRNNLEVLRTIIHYYVANCQLCAPIMEFTNLFASSPDLDTQFNLMPYSVLCKVLWLYFSE